MADRCNSIRAIASATLLAFVLAGVAPAFAERRVALVVGIDRYENLPADQQLQKATNDARAVADAFRRLGFEVILGENLGRQAFVDKLDEFTQRLTPGDVAAFFFAGHGAAIGGGNFILPSDVPNVQSGQDTRLARAGLGENDIISDLLSRGARVALVILDACRNNPFKRPGLRAVGGERGLVRSEPVRGVFSLYSAGIGQTALDRLGQDDTSPNSVFTRVLAPALGKPGLHLGDLAVEVREQVARIAATIGHDQRPAYYDELVGGKFYLAGLSSAAGLPPPAAAPIQPVPKAPGTAVPAAATMRVLTGHDDPVTAVAFSPDGTRLVSMAQDATIRFWDVASGRPIHKLMDYLGGDGIALAFSPDGARVLHATSKGALNLWEPWNKTLGAGLLIGGPILKGRISSVAFSADGRHAAFASADRTIRLFRSTALMTSSRSPLQTFTGHGATINALAFSPDGRRLVSASADRSVRLWSIETGKLILTFQGQSVAATSVAMSHDGALIASGSANGTLLLWAADDGRLVQTLKGHSADIAALAFSADGRHLASASRDNTARLWDVTTGRHMTTLEGHTDHVTAVAFSPAGEWIASASKDHTVRLWPIDAKPVAGNPR